MQGNNFPQWCSLCGLEGILTVTAPDARQKGAQLDQTPPETLTRILADELETEQRKSVN
jgi:hypothetical protein